MDDFEDISDDDLLDVQSRLGTLSEELRRVSDRLEAEKQRRDLVDKNTGTARAGS
jgi:hypothetical protein